MKSNETLAIESVRTKEGLRKRFASYVSCFRPRFGRIADYRIDLTEKTATSADGKVRLVWQTRQRPDLPESYHNQQTSVGFVRAEILTP